MNKTKREPEYCDDCGEVVGYYDPTLPPGEKIIITKPCYCWETPAMTAKRLGAAS